MQAFFRLNIIYFITTRSLRHHRYESVALTGFLVEG